MAKVMIWRDDIDPAYYGVGIRSEYGRIVKWCEIHAEGIRDIFGNDVSSRLHQLTPGGKPVEVVLTLAFVETEAGSGTVRHG